MNIADIPGLIAQGLGLHQRGQLDQAADLYGRVLQIDPRNFAALQLLGVLRSQQGRNAEAGRMLEAALAIQPKDFGALANYGQALAADGRYGEALHAFDKALAVKPDFFEALYNKGVALAQLQRPAEAVACFDRALTLNPRHAPCLYNRAISLAATGRREDAVASFEAALALNPNLAPAWNNRGNVLRDLGRAGQALESYDRAVALMPGDAALFYNRGHALSDLGRPAEALASYDRALALQPDFSPGWSSRGRALLALERYGEAVESFDKALALNPDADAWNDRGVALWHQGLPAQARASYDQALKTLPGHVPTLLNRAFLLQETGEPVAALSDYDRAVAAEPGNARAWNGRGAVLHALKRGHEALADFDKALALEPGLVDALTNRALLQWSERGDHAKAVADIKAVLAINPDQPFARGELLHLKMFGADWEDFEREEKAITDAVRLGQRVVRPFVYQALSQSPADLQRCSRIFAAGLTAMPADKPPAFSHLRDKIRIGYVSGEFREQATAYLMAGLYEQHDRERFEIIAIDNGGGDGSAMRRRLEAAFDRFVPIARLSDADAVALIRREEIDILVNLNGYFGAPRMGIFARRAAPVQVNYLGFPATLGAPYMDYILADRIVIPEAERQFYDEQVVYLPYSYQANDDKRPIADQVPSRQALGLPENGFVFCNFNQSYKITPVMFACWMRILRAVEGSVLWLLTSRPPFEANVRREAEKHGIDSRRLVFAANLPPERHLARLKQADLFLDSLPYNAHTTASDALWAGLPLLTCRGSAFPGRVATSLLAAIDMPELITESMEAYDRRAVALARDPQLLSELKSKLARNRLTQPLFNTGLFRKNIEKAYIGMWQAWRSGEQPKGFEVEPTQAAGH